MDVDKKRNTSKMIEVFETETFTTV